MDAERRFIVAPWWFHEFHLLYILSRRKLKSVLEVMALDNSSTSWSGSDEGSEEDDMDILVCELAFRPKIKLGNRLHIADLSELECEQLFRY